MTGRAPPFDDYGTANKAMLDSVPHTTPCDELGPLAALTPRELAIWRAGARATYRRCIEAIRAERPDSLYNDDQREHIRRVAWVAAADVTDVEIDLLWDRR